MKNVKHFILITSLVLVIQGCSAENEQEAIQSQSQEVSQTEEQTTKEDVKPADNESSSNETNLDSAEETEEVVATESSEIDTSVFAYAEEVDVTDALDITEHINIVVFMNEELSKGMATKHAISQAYDFLQQDRVKDAKTVTIGVMSGDLRIAQITVDMSKFKVDDEKPMVGVVMDASEIDKMNDEVKEFGEALELW